MTLLSLIFRQEEIQTLWMGLVIVILALQQTVARMSTLSRGHLVIFGAENEGLWTSAWRCV